MAGNIAFIGLGIMGRPMAANLATAGFSVTAHSRGRRSDPELEATVRIADSTAGAVAGADIVAIMVPDSPDVESVMRSPGGVLDTAAPGTLVIDFSSISPETARSVAASAAAASLSMLDAPVSGGQAGAVAASLSIMVGGAAADFDRAKPVLDAVGRTVIHVGPSGSGQTVKAANQLIVAANIQVLAEAVLFLEAHQVDIDAALDVLAGGLAGSAVLDQKRSKMQQRSFDPGFRIALHHKDLTNAMDAARAKGLVAPVSGLVSQLMSAEMANGDAALDHSALLRGLERLNGLYP